MTYLFLTPKYMISVMMKMRNLKLRVWDQQTPHNILNLATARRTDLLQASTIQITVIRTINIIWINITHQWIIIFLSRDLIRDQQLFTINRFHLHTIIISNHLTHHTTTTINTMIRDSSLHNNNRENVYILLRDIMMV